MVGREFSSTITRKKLPVRMRNMTVSYHTQFQALKRTASVFLFHHITAEIISNSTPVAPDSCGRAPSYSLKKTKFGE
jgi:hypothetical protein